MTISTHSASGGFQLRSVLAYNLLLALGIITFSVGLLRPIPQVPLSPQADFHGDALISPPDARFDRVIFMVIDALRRYLTVPQIFSRLWVTDHRVVIWFSPTRRGLASHRGMSKMASQMDKLETVLLIELVKPHPVRPCAPIYQPCRPSQSHSPTAEVHDHGRQSLVSRSVSESC